MNHHIVIIHGIGKAKAGYSLGLAESIEREYKNLSSGKENACTLIFHEVLWDDVVSFEQARLAQVLRKGFGLAVRETAQNLFMKVITLPKAIINALRTDIAAEYIEDVLSYREKTAYALIHGRLADVLAAIARENLPAQLSIVAHSLGTVIASDHIYDCQKSGGTLAGQVAFKNFFTLGSPIALFALQYGGVEIFKSPARLEDSSGVWLNIFDKDDPVGYPLKTLNDTYNTAVTGDVLVSTGIFGVSHMRYFESKAVQRLIAGRL